MNQEANASQKWSKIQYDASTSQKTPHPDNVSIAKGIKLRLKNTKVKTITSHSS
jgi:hypothetical protein